MHIFTASEFTGEPIETDEMRPQWFDESALPKDEMWKSDLFWWPYFLDGKKFKGAFHFDEKDAVDSHKIEVD